MDDRPSVSNLNQSYNDFLFATVCDEANGMRLSVLSALARANVDPWEEATRLAGMPRAIAARTLASFLALASSTCGNSPEAEAAAARLVRLLPHASGQSANADAGRQIDMPQLTSYWWVWVGLALVVSFILPQHPDRIANPDMAPSTFSEPAPQPKPGAAKTSAAFPASTNAPDVAPSEAALPESSGMAQ